MSLIDKIKGEFVDIVEWLDDSRDTIVWRFPRYDNELKMGAKLVVRDSADPGRSRRYRHSDGSIMSLGT